jgi:glycosyltransferase involved in cell wall biosynthesis
VAWKYALNSASFDDLWQSPAITEQHAWQLMAERVSAFPEGVFYFAFPWASLIDGLERKTALGDKLLAELRTFRLDRPRQHVITVCQHIKFRRHLALFKDAGITDIFASHAVRGEAHLDGMRIHPFPLYPVVRPAADQNSARFSAEGFRHRAYLYSFVGAYDSRYYLTDVRQLIGLLEQRDNARVVVRDQWHFEKRVYQEQVFGNTLSAIELEEEQAAQQHYRATLEQSQFSLCPSGTGPNSIRLWESIEFGCIPVILADSLALPGDRALWEKACIFIEESAEAVRRIPEILTQVAKEPRVIEEKLTALQMLRDRYGAETFVFDTQQLLNAVGKGDLAHGARPAHKDIYLNLCRVAPFAQLAWLQFIQFLAREAKLPLKISVSAVGLGPAIRAFCLGEHFRRSFPDITLVDSFSPPAPSESFVFLSGSQVLSKKILSRFDRFHVEPASPPSLIEPGVYGYILFSGDYLAQLESTVAAADPAMMDAVEAYRTALRCADGAVTLITSVFKGDQFLEGFLENCAQLSQYHDSEHLLIRANSPGGEHARLMQHAREWPGATYINLVKDPGLYEVWNLGARLATRKYLSNANLDDRRSPEHLVKLQGILDADASVDVVSSALRVTETKNLPWDDSPGCSCWYTEQGNLRYTVEHLAKFTGSSLAANNMPHCMPLWRRELHAAHGYFNEKDFGPSADWEFWLRVGSGGGRFHLLGEPLGLYLKDEGSYWRRSISKDVYEAEIAQRYLPILKGEDSPADEKPISWLLTELRRLEECFSCLEVVAKLVEIFHQGRTPRPLTPRSKDLLVKLGEYYFGYEDLYLLNPSMTWPSGIQKVITFVIDVLHRRAWREEGSISERLPFLTGFFLDLHAATDDVTALLGLAFMCRQVNDREQESRLLKQAHAAGGVDFWSAWQRVYRFTVSLDDMTSQLTSITVGPSMEDPDQLNLFFYPDYSAGNPYQELLYSKMVSAGGSVKGLNSVEEIHSIIPQEAKQNILHIHWINALFNDVTDYNYEIVAQEFLDAVKMIKARGVKVYWTVHNRLSHEAVDSDKEIEFRRQLSRMVDRLYLHHPMSVHLLDWMATDKVFLVEHGNYLGLDSKPMDMLSARGQLGLDRQDFVVAHFGLIREYKGLEKYLPVFLEAMQTNPRLKLIVCGKIRSPGVKELLSRADKRQVILEDRFIPDTELQTYLSAADLCFLSYKDILTSGSIFQTFSFGVPVIAPRLGNLPAYVVEGWNGYLYEDVEGLRSILRHAAQEPARCREHLRSNALATAKKVEWRFF